MSYVQISIGNARSKAEGSPEILKLLRFELSVPAGEPTTFRNLQPDGSVQIRQWDGYRRLMTKQGVFPSGLIPRVQRLLTKWSVAHEFKDRRPKPLESVPRWTMPDSFELRDYQSETCDRAERIGRGVIDSPPRCISGDTRIQIHRAGKTFWLTMRDLVHRFNGGEIRFGKGLGLRRRWDPSITTQIRSRDGEGYVRLFEIERAWSSGEKELKRIRLASGFELIGSAEHPVLSQYGWVSLEEIKCGMKVIAELPRGNRCAGKKRSYPFRTKLWGHPFAGRRGRIQGPFCVQTHRLVYEAHLNGLDLETYLERLRNGSCGDLQFLDPAEFAVHHKDENPKNNDIDNLELLDHVEHWKRHGVNGGWKQVAFDTGPVEVVDVDHAGAGDTYDIEVPAAGNFLADRIVTHNSGKTIMMAELVRRVAVPTVITAPTRPICQQTHSKLLELFRENEWSGQIKDCAADFYLMLGSPKTRKEHLDFRRALVVVTTADSALNIPRDYWDRVECFIVDERHHQAAKTYHKLNDLATNAYWRWGFTGTNYRSNPGEQVALEACLGRTVANYTVEDMIRRKVLVPASVDFYPVDHPGMRALKFSPAYQAGVVDDDFRNRIIVHSARELMAEGRRTLVLVQRLDHGKKLEAMIPGSKFVKGEDNEEVGKAVRALNDGSLQCLIGSPVVGEGLDCPGASGLVYAKGQKAKVTHTQDMFRVMTADGTKRDARIIDIADRHNRTLLDHSVERMQNYLAAGVTCRVHSNPPIDGPQLEMHN